MNEIPQGLELDPKTYGTVVNQVKPKADPVEQQIKEIEAPFTVTIKLTPSELVRFDRVADDFKLTRDEYVAKLCKESLESVGKACITAPSFASGKRVMSPTFNVQRSDR